MRVQACAARCRAGDVTADTAGGFAEDTETRTGECRETLREDLERRGLRVMRREVADEHGGRFTAAKRGGDALRFVARRDTGEVGIDGLAADRGGCDDHFGQGARQRTRCDGEIAAERNQRIVLPGADGRELQALACRGADAHGEQRMVLAEVGTDDEHALQQAHVRDRQAEPRGTTPLAVEREVGLTQPEVDVVAAETVHQLRAEE